MNLYNKFIMDGTVFWINLYQLNRESIKIKDFELLASIHIKNLVSWTHSFVNEKFQMSLKVARIQFIVNPINSRPQRWHIDYNNDFSAIFIPLVELDCNNSPQFISFPAEGEVDLNKAIINPHNVDLNNISPGDDSYYSSQVCCGAFSILYMEPGTIHRGVGNKNNIIRPMLCVELIPSESAIEISNQNFIENQDTSIK